MVPEEQVKQTSCPAWGSKTHISSCQVVKEPHVRSAISDYLAQLSLTPVPGRAEPVGNSSVPGEGQCEEGGTQDENCLDKAQGNAVESYRIRFYCKGLIYRISVQFSRSVMSDSLQPHELQYTRPSCPSPTPGVHPNSCPSSR